VSARIVARYEKMECPVCGTHTKGCSRTEDGFQICRGEPVGDGWVLLWQGSDFRGYRSERDLDNKRAVRHLTDRPRKPKRNKPVGTVAGESCDLPTEGAGEQQNTPAVAPSTPSTKPTKSRNWPAEAAVFASTLASHPEAREELADKLRLPVEALNALPGLGVSSRSLAGWTFTFPETDAAGTVVGITERSPAGGKKNLFGGKRGLTIPAGWRDRGGPLVVVEGPTDVLALTLLGFACVGRPSNTGGAKLLAELVATLPADQPVIILGENDRKPNGLFPGLDGAIDTAEKVAEYAGRTVFRAMPPDGVKDARDYVAGKLAKGVSLADQYAELTSLFYDSAVCVDPPKKFDPAMFKGLCGPKDAKPASNGYAAGFGCGESNAACECESFGVVCERASCPKERNKAYDELARSDRKPRLDLPPELTTIIGKAPRWRPCRHPRYRPRVGDHPTTAGTFDVLRTTCGKCHPCQEKARHIEKLTHCSAAYLTATHVWDGEEGDWQALESRLYRLRKKLGIKKPFGFARIIQSEDGRRLTLYSFAGSGIPEETLAENGFRPVAGADAARMAARAIDNIPFVLPKRTKRILSSETWRAASLYKQAEPERKEERLYIDLEPQQLQGPDLDWAANAAEEENADTERRPLRHPRIEDRLIVIPPAWRPRMRCSGSCSA
jgi:hypothetical protein